jgi:phosphoglycolate phosphatase-like HAD superfamily hydrolase
MVGDKWIDVETGLKSKMNAALVRSGKEINSEIENHASIEKVPIYDDILSFYNSCIL